MFKTVLNTTVAVSSTVKYLAVDNRRFNKKLKAAQKAQAQDDARIAASREKIGSYVPTPCPVQIWA